MGCVAGERVVQYLPAKAKDFFLFFLFIFSSLISSSSSHSLSLSRHSLLFRERVSLRRSSGKKQQRTHKCSLCVHPSRHSVCVYRDLMLHFSINDSSAAYSRHLLFFFYFFFLRISKSSNIRILS